MISIVNNLKILGAQISFRLDFESKSIRELVKRYTLSRVSKYPVQNKQRMLLKVIQISFISYSPFVQMFYCRNSKSIMQI